MEKIKGIIYKYKSPSNKVYIGQTLNEERRKKEFQNLNDKYGGKKIENARKKHGPQNFEYTVLFQKEFCNIEEAIKELNLKEIEFIQQYDSIKNGYNISSGGDSLRNIMRDVSCKERMINSLKKYYETHDNPFKGKKHTDETKKILREKALGRPSNFRGCTIDDKKRSLQSENLKKYYETHNNPFKGKKHSDETLKKIKETRQNLIAQINAETNEIIHIYPNLSQAARAVHNSKYTDIIRYVCEGYVSPLTGVKYETAYGYKWKFIKKDEGSTTIEQTL